MIEHRGVEEIGGTENGWLRAKHHFAIGPYGNPAHKRVGNLYVLNDDEIAPHNGFPPHDHANVEIVTFVREGVVSHKDSLGNVGHIRAGDVQVMSAGTGIRHSEGNEGEVPARLFQMWLSPIEPGGEPKWGTRSFPSTDREGHFVLLASRTGRDGSLSIRSNAEVFGATLSKGLSVLFDLANGEQAYVVSSTGRLNVSGEELPALDGLALRDERQLRIEALQDSQVLLVVSKKG